MPVIRRPSQDELFRALVFGFQHSL